MAAEELCGGGTGLLLGVGLARWRWPSRAPAAVETNPGAGAGIARQRRGPRAESTQLQRAPGVGRGALDGVEVRWRRRGTLGGSEIRGRESGEHSRRGASLGGGERLTGGLTVDFFYFLGERV